MCSKCDQLSETMARYKRLRQQLNDQQMRDAADRLVAKLEAEKLALHPKS